MPSQSLLFQPQHSPKLFIDQLRKSSALQAILAYLREAVPELEPIPQTTYSLYRQFARSGERGQFENRYFNKRDQLTRAVVELILGDDRRLDLVQDLVWDICEETSWVLPAHEELGPGFPDPDKPTAWSGGTNTSLTREPDFIDLFAAETGAGLAEVVFLLEDQLAPEVVQRVRQEIERRICLPYLAYGRKFWWHHADLNWNAVCNGAVGLAFMRMERDPRRLAEAMTLVLEGLDAYITKGFEADGGSLEGIGYWNYGLLYYIALAEEIRERSSGQIDLLASERMKAIAGFPIAVAIAPGKYFNYADADEMAFLQPGTSQRLAQRTGVTDLAGLIISPEAVRHHYSAAKLSIVLRDLAWWDGKYQPFPESALTDAYLPSCALVKLVAKISGGQNLMLAAKAGFNSGHHNHLDIGHFIINIDGEDLLCDPGRGLYSKSYFSEKRFENVFCNSFGHSVPRIGGRLQMPGPRFNGGRLAQGKIIGQGHTGACKVVEIDFHEVYGLPELTLARRKLEMDVHTGGIILSDRYEFTTSPLEIEEAFVTWCSTTVEGAKARVDGKKNQLLLTIQEPAGAAFNTEILTEDCRANQHDGTLTRLSVRLPPGAQQFIMQIVIQ